MNILYVMPRFHTNQIPIFRGMKEKGHSVSCFVEYLGETENHDTVVPVQMNESFVSRMYLRYLKKRYSDKPSVVESRHGAKFIPAIFPMMKALKKIAPDIVILRERSIASAVVFSTCKCLGINAVMTYNQSPLYRTTVTSGTRMKVKRSFFPAVTYTPVAYSIYPQTKEQAFYTEDNTYFVPFVAESKEYERLEYCCNGLVRFLDVGKYRDYKNHFVLADAARCLIEAGKTNFRITVIGQASNTDELEYFDRLKKYIKEIGAEKYFELKQNIPFVEMNDMYMRHDVFVLTSKKELASIAILEAMANGVSVITTSANGTASYVEPGITGGVFQTCDANSLATEMMAYIDDTSIAETRGKKAWEKASIDYGFSGYYSKFSEVVKKEFMIEVR